MTTINALHTQDSTLREQYDADPETVKAAQINAFLERVRQTGQTTGSIQEREHLLGMIRFWAPVIEEKTGEKPEIKLAPYDPDAKLDETETAVFPTEDDDQADDNAQGTSMSGQAQDDQSQTLAQLFMTLPAAAKAFIFIVIALILAGIIYSILTPDSEETLADGPATETAVSAAITASAQPTGTATATATPPIYIESESSSVDPAPVGLPTPIIYIVQQGDTLNKIARTYGVPVQDIATLNNIYNADSIAVGQELLIPTPLAAAETAVPRQSVVATAEPPVNLPPGSASELVIRGVESVELRIAAGPDYQAITTLPQGTFATVVAKTPDGIWYLIQLKDGFTRGWVQAEYTALIFPADPSTIPTTPMP